MIDWFQLLLDAAKTTGADRRLSVHDLRALADACSNASAGMMSSLDEHAAALIRCKAAGIAQLESGDFREEQIAGGVVLALNALAYDLTH